MFENIYAISEVCSVTQKGLCPDKDCQNTAVRNRSVPSRYPAANASIQYDVMDRRGERGPGWHFFQPGIDILGICIDR